MHVAVIGAGIAGVTAAYELAVDGHRVTVFERHGTVAAEASFAQAGLLFADPMALEGVHGLAVRDGGSGRGRGLQAATLGWLRRVPRLRGGGPGDALRPALDGLAAYGRERLRTLTQSLRLDYEHSRGCLLPWRTVAEKDHAAPALDALAGLGLRAESLDAAGCRIVEPGLSTETGIVGGLWLPDEFVGNCRQFVHLMRQQAERLGVRFRFDTTVQRIEAGAEPRLVSVQAPLDETAPRGTGVDGPDTVPLVDGPRTRPFDAIVVCAAAGAPALLQPLGLRLPLRVVHGYSITAPLRHNDLHPDLGPRSAVVDLRRGVAVTRLGGRVRVAGGAGVDGRPDRIDAAAIAALHGVLHDWFPGAAQLEAAQRWKGARPMLPDGAPLFGRAGPPGVWLDLGHGANGWALACGAARALADRIAGRPAAVGLDGFGIGRLGSPTP